MNRQPSLININSLLGEVVYRFNNHPDITFVFPKTEIKVYSDYAALKYIFYELIAQQLRDSALEILVDATKNSGKVSFTISATKTGRLDNLSSNFLLLIPKGDLLKIKNDPLVAVKKMLETLGGTLVLAKLKNKTIAYSFAIPIEFEENISSNTTNISLDSEEDFSKAA